MALERFVTCQQHQSHSKQQQSSDFPSLPSTRQARGQHRWACAFAWHQVYWQMSTDERCVHQHERMTAASSALAPNPLLNIHRGPAVWTPLPYLTLPPGWAGSYTCPALRPYQFGPMRVPECNQKVTGSGYKAVDGCEDVNERLRSRSRLWSRNQHKSTGNV